MWFGDVAIRLLDVDLDLAIERCHQSDSDLVSSSYFHANDSGRGQLTDIVFFIGTSIGSDIFCSSYSDPSYLSVIAVDPALLAAIAIPTKPALEALGMSCQS
jgi:hypothetical protein